MRFLTLACALLVAPAHAGEIGVKSCAKLEPGVRFCATAKAWNHTRIRLADRTLHAIALPGEDFSGLIQLHPTANDPKSGFEIVVGPAVSDQVIEAADPFESKGMDGFRINLVAAKIAGREPQTKAVAVFPLPQGVLSVEVLSVRPITAEQTQMFLQRLLLHARIKPDAKSQD